MRLGSVVPLVAMQKCHEGGQELELDEQVLAWPETEAKGHQARNYQLRDDRVQGAGSRCRSRRRRCWQGRPTLRAERLIENGLAEGIELDRALRQRPIHEIETDTDTQTAAHQSMSDTGE